MGITAFKFVIWGGKSAVLWLQITFYGTFCDKFECSYPLII